MCTFKIKVVFLNKIGVIVLVSVPGLKNPSSALFLAWKGLNIILLISNDIEVKVLTFLFIGCI